ncbi:MAG: thiamine diphosphokinase [Faecalicoccus sp.]|nr:thiamine diphosphokinase [Faecalicoccus sp.]
MKTAILITPRTQEIPEIEGDYFGVDAGSLILMEAGIPMKMAIGDFDSMEMDKLDQIKQVTEVHIHPVMKDETDTELAVVECLKMGYEKIYVTGAMSGRLDHTYANLVLLEKYPEMILIDEFQRAACLKKGTYTIKKLYKHVSFFARELSEISLKGFLWPLDHVILYPDDIYAVSNSIEDDYGNVEIHSGSVLCIQSNYK